MTDRYQEIRDALAMGPTQGPWSACGSAGYVKAGEGDLRDTILAVVYGHGGNHCLNAPGSRENGNYIAACDPDTIRALLAERDALREALTECLRVNETDAGDDVAVWANAMLVARAALAQEQGEKNGNV